MNKVWQSINSRTLLGAVLVILLLLLSMAIYQQITKEEDTAKNIPASASINEDTRRVFIQNIHLLNRPLSLTIERGIENTLYAYSLENNSGTPDLFTGIIRLNSYARKDNGITTFLVEVYPSNITYRVTANDTLGEDSYITVGCAPEAQQAQRGTTCKELDGIT